MGIKKDGYLVDSTVVIISQHMYKPSYWLKLYTYTDSDCQLFLNKTGKSQKKQ